MLPLGIWAVSYTHLDVYKRQLIDRVKAPAEHIPFIPRYLDIILDTVLSGNNRGQSQLVTLFHLIGNIQGCLLYTSREGCRSSRSDILAHACRALFENCFASTKLSLLEIGVQGVEDIVGFD